MRPTARALGTIAAIASLAMGCLAWQAPPASAAPGCRTASSDFDRDGTPDVAVGIPGGSGRNGAVRVRLSNNGRPVTTTITGAPGFGSALTSLSSYQKAGDDALCSQLVVGSPDESLSTDKTRSGVVYVYAWNRSAGRFALRGQFYPQAQGVAGLDQSGARFGAALAAEQRRAGDTESRPTRLFVGAPGMDIDDGRDTGRVTSFWIDDDEDPTAHDTKIVQLGEPFTDEPTPGAALGSSLSVGGGLVAMGMPGYSTARVRDAGAVLVDALDANPDSPLPLVLTQDTRRVPGTAEPGDRFGAAVHLVPAAGGGLPTLLVGSPGEDVGRVTDAGTVTIAQISVASLDLSGPVRTLDQDSAGMAGTAERGDQLGTAVSSMRAGSQTLYLVGVPGEDVGGVRDAGMVQTIGNGQGWTQRTRGVPGVAEPGDRMGAALGGAPSTGARSPLIGVPGENASTGAVLVGLPLGGGSVGYLRGTTVGGRFGLAVGP